VETGLCCPKMGRGSKVDFPIRSLAGRVGSCDEGKGRSGDGDDEDDDEDDERIRGRCER
jgi:hypothetical protein